MKKLKAHSQKIKQLQESIRYFISSKEISSPLALHYHTGYSNTTRQKSYKRHCPKLDFGQLNEVIQIDLERKVAIVEPRVTMEALLQATLAYQLMPPLLPEFKGITVGGAIMGGAGESSSLHWGCFNDICDCYEIICGNGHLLKASPSENQDIYYGIASSYGSLGALVSAAIQLVPAPDFVYLRYHFFSNPLEALEKMQDLFQGIKGPDFLDGIIFNQNLSVIVEGNLHPEESSVSHRPLFSFNSSQAEWFYQHVKRVALHSQANLYEEKMSLEDYFFRYDLGGFWMGAYLFHIPFLWRFISQGMLGFRKINKENFSESEIHRFHEIPDPPLLGRVLFRPFLKAQTLWALLHKAENWIQNRMIIQDFCIPASNAMKFCKDILNPPIVFPIWLCPIKGTHMPQIFAPHLLVNNHTDKHLINFGLYGIPWQASSIRYLTRKLEQDAHSYGGRKALYSHSYYTSEEFWQIYSRKDYEALRKRMWAQGIWHEITEKVLSE
jgi:delta24-sterol reductase